MLLSKGVVLGGMFPQHALGMALMFGVLRIVNISHGDLVILLALIGISFATKYAVGPFTSLLMLVPLAAFLGWSLQRAILNRVVGADPLPSLIATFGLSIALQNLKLQIWSDDTRSMPRGGIEQASFQVGPLFIGVLPVIVLVVATGLTGSLDILLRFTRFGRALRDSSADVEAAAMTGVNPKVIYSLATAIALSIPGFAAVFQGLRSTVAPSDGTFQLIYACEALIIGGMGSIWGAFIGSMVKGISQSVGFHIDPGFGILAGHLVFLIVLGLMTLLTSLYARGGVWGLICKLIYAPWFPMRRKLIDEGERNESCPVRQSRLPLRIETLADPTPTPDEAVLRIEACGICGSDLHITEEPVTFGIGQGAVLVHEFAAEVVAVGGAVTNLRQGDRVGVAPMWGCGACDSCRRGDPAWCSQMRLIGGG